MYHIFQNKLLLFGRKGATPYVFGVLLLFATRQSSLHEKLGIYSIP